VNGAISETIAQRLQQLNAIGIALSAEKDAPRLLEMILLGAKQITGADGGTLYTVTPDHKLQFEIIRTDSMHIAMGGTSGAPIPYPPIPLRDADGKPNDHMVVAYAALRERTVNIADAYTEEGFDFSGTRNFDAHTGYRSHSFLTIPMKDHENDVIGVLQLINKLDAATGAVIPFDADDQRLAESLASQAAVALTNKRLISELKALFEAFIQLIAGAIDDKSPYTGGHCRRVPVLTMMLARAAHAAETGPLKDFTLTEKDIYELEIAAWLHDCGKITTPEYVVDKATKLETIFDRIDLVRMRYEILRRDARIACLERQLAAARSGDDVAMRLAQQEYDRCCEQFADELGFLERSNVGGEFMSGADQDRVRTIAQRGWADRNGVAQPLLTENEIYNLCIARGTLNNEERRVINNHIVATIKMLEALPFPKHLRNVPEYAGGHHERMDGKGYPNGLRREQMSVQARIMAIADIFEALTAADRPYKSAKRLSESIAILGKMKKDQHIDPDLFDVFITSKVYLRYAEQFLTPQQIDVREPAEIPGFPFA
jgi:HD-GYP domain-containing protein (c-di-GMP phosphodiesterase class II)